MLLREVEYARPASVEEAVRVLSEHDGARPLAGGQTLVNVMKQRAASPDVLVDLGALAELRAISVAGGSLELGAMATLAAIGDSSEVDVTRPVLAEVVRTIADVQVRNRGTIGGNICVNDPTNHLPPLLVALDATMTVRGTAGERKVPAEDFFVGVYETAVGEGELLTGITIPARAPGSGDGFSAVTIGAHGTCIVNAAASVTGDGAPRVVLGCMAAVPVLLRPAGTGADDVRRAVADASLDPPSDVHASADYRRHLAQVSAVRAVQQAAERARG